ncbi:uncharacterized protein LOC124260641 [Haliotis rubra]|uniref:uncharacterized protein LOC124260641 n=1 Tax=Haliotis rubra TaxID=36100 RepID=UPI001EE50591|nr:uncharacterized protein LOC124260641 [Haliotis rubra]
MIRAVFLILSWRELAPTKSWDEVPLDHESNENHTDGPEEEKDNEEEETKGEEKERKAEEAHPRAVPSSEIIPSCDKEKDNDSTDKNALSQDRLDITEDDKDIQQTLVTPAKWTISSRKRARRHKLQPKLTDTVIHSNDLKNKVRESKKDQQKKKKAEKVNDRRELSGVSKSVMETS